MKMIDWTEDKIHNRKQSLSTKFGKKNLNKFMSTNPPLPLKGANQLQAM